MASLEVTNPADGTVIENVHNSSVLECLEAVNRAHDAAQMWRTTAPRERGEILRKAFEIMLANRDSLAELITRENGKVLADAQAEVAYAAEFFRWFSEEAVRIDGDYRRAPNGGNWLLVSRQPVGVALLATPWNFPAAMATRKIGPALAAGCTAVLKPAHETPLTAIAITKILRDAGLPDGVLNTVVTDQPGAAVEAILDSGRVRKLSFTGSTRVGSLLIAQAAKRVINCSMELGGNAPLIVFEDADLDAAIDGAMIAKMRNGGAACTAANRLFVHENIYEEFAARFTDRMSSLRVGNGLDSGTNLGPLVSSAQQERVAALVSDAVTDGATIACGGKKASSVQCGYEATVLVDVPIGARILNEEVFGPVAPLVRFGDTDEVIAHSNSVEHGLVSYVFTQDVGKGMRVAESLETGMVGLNRGLVSDPSAPFGGVKASGIGREGGHDGLLAFLETKYVAGNW